MMFPPSAGAGPGENQIILFFLKTQNSRGFSSSLFLIHFLSKWVWFWQKWRLFLHQHTEWFSLTGTCTESWQGFYSTLRDFILHILRPYSGGNRFMCLLLSCWSLTTPAHKPSSTRGTETSRAARLSKRKIPNPKSDKTNKLSIW